MGLGNNITIASLHCAVGTVKVLKDLWASGVFWGRWQSIFIHANHHCQPQKGRVQSEATLEEHPTVAIDRSCLHMGGVSRKRNWHFLQNSIPSASLSGAFVKTWAKYKGDWNQKLPDRSISIFRNLTPAVENVSRSCILVQDKQKVQTALEPDTSRFLLKNYFQFGNILAQFWR